MRVIFMRKRIMLLSLFVLLLPLFTLDAFAADSGEPEIRLNNCPISTNAYITEEGELYLPVRTIGEALGFNVGWSQSDRTVSMVSAGKLILLTDSTILVDDHQYYIPGRRIIVQGRKFMRQDFFNDNLALRISWDKIKNTVSLDSIQENQITIKTVNEFSDSYGLKITLQYPEINGLENDQIQSSINALFKEKAKNAAKEGQKNADELAAFFKENPDSPLRPCETYFDYRVKYNQNNVLSIVFLNYQYSGGAHGYTVQTSHTFNLKTGVDYSLGELFKAGSDYIGIMSSSVKTQLMERDLDNSLLVAFDKIRENHSYYLSNYGVVVYFQQYEILPYAAGIQEFETDFNALKDLLKEPDLIK